MSFPDNSDESCPKVCPYSSSCLLPLLPLVTSDRGEFRLVTSEPKYEGTSPFQDEKKAMAQWCDFSPFFVTSGMSCMQLLILRLHSYPTGQSKVVIATIAQFSQDAIFITYDSEVSLV